MVAIQDHCSLARYDLNSLWHAANYRTRFRLFQISDLRLLPLPDSPDEWNMGLYLCGALAQNVCSVSRISSQLPGAEHSVIDSSKPKIRCALARPALGRHGFHGFSGNELLFP